MKKPLSLLLGLVMVLGLLGAPALAEQEAPMPITWVSYQMGAIYDDAIMIKYWNDFFNVDIQVWNLDNSRAADQYSLWFASNQIPDFMGLGFSLADFGKYVQQQVLAEIPEDLLMEHMPGTIAKLETDRPGCTGYGVIDGVRYGIPREVRFHNQFRGPLAYRGDWMEAVGVDKVPETLADFENLMYKYAKDDPDGNGQADTYGLSKSGLEPVYGAFGYIPKLWKEIDGKLAYTSIQPEMKDALATLAKWYADGVLAPDYTVGENHGGYWAITHDFTEGKIGFSGHGAYYHWHPDIGVGENHIPAAMAASQGEEAAAKITFGAPFTGPSGKAYTKGSAMYDGNQVAFGVHLEDDPVKMAKIMDMLEYWHGGDVEHFFEGFFGIKDVMWEYNADGVPTVKAPYKQEELSMQGAHVLLACIGTLDTNAVMYKYRYDWAIENGFLEGEMMYSDLLAPLPSRSTYWSDLEKLEDEYFTGIITGNEPLEKFDEFVTEWLANGGEILTQEANDWWSSLAK
ncbi:MAG TPA: hypothetical protein PKE04_12785 [Clostridia bacterium]|nr:hypothetical protein [Clostridia bacterium]